MPQSLTVGCRPTLSITSLITDGRGLARHDGRAVFVTDALPGQTVEAEITALKPRFAEARRTRIISTAPNSREALCRHHDECGGCSWQCMLYENQLAWKASFVADAMARIGKVKEPPVLPALPSPREWGYRNKMEFAFSGQGDALALGLYRRASHELVNVDGCLLQTKRTMAILDRARAIAAQSAAPAWSRDTREGLWRFLVIREPAAGGCLVELILAPHQDAAAIGEAFAYALREDCPDISGIIVSTRSAAGNVAYGERELARYGTVNLYENIGDARFALGAGAFFQVNTTATELLYRQIADLAGTEAKHVWDLYCGVGSIGLYLARTNTLRSITGVEQSAEAVSLARENAASFDVAATYYQGDVARHIGNLSRHAPKPDLVIVDPPRAGLDAKITNALCRLKPPAILYVSCDPATLARDIARLVPFTLKTVQPVDLFPQTPHIESVSLLLRR